MIGRKQKGIGLLFVIAGVVTSLYALLLDVIAGQSFSFGPAQFGLLVIGLVVLVLGFVLRRKQIVFKNLILIAASLALTFIFLEVAIRIVGYTDKDDQFILVNIRLRPYAHKISRTQELLDEYFSADSPFIIYDPFLGWTVSPSSISQDGYQTNSVGMRSDREYILDPEEGVTRIVIFGDSFTFGSQVNLEESWAFKTENGLQAQGYPNEVLNFGVGGYGMDQAYLRYQHEGIAYQPDIVVLGFQPENMLRNVNVVRSIYRTASGNPFTKPRFVLQGDELILINSPTVAPEDIPSMLATFNASSLAAYEYHLDTVLFEDHWWLESKALALLMSVAGNLSAQNTDGRAGYYTLSGEPAQVTLALIEQFAEETENNGSIFVILHLPTANEIRLAQAGEALPYQAVLDNLKENYYFVETIDAFDDLSASEYVVPPHYNDRGTSIVADRLIEAINVLLSGD